VGIPLLTVGLRVGWHRWPWLLGAGAILLLLAGWLERWWQSRPLTHSPSRSRSKARSRFRVVDGGRAADGRRPEPDPEDESDDPKWLM
jgi:protein-S-isoprenylcysteine O-methyltransferase Ste14